MLKHVLLTAAGLGLLAATAGGSAQVSLRIDGDAVVPAGQLDSITYRLDSRELRVQSVHADWRCSADPASSTPDVGDGDFRLVFDQVNPATERGAVYRVAPTAEGGSITQAKAGDTILGIVTTSDPGARLTCAPFRESFFSGDFENLFAFEADAPTITAPGSILTVPVTITNQSRSRVSTFIQTRVTASVTPDPTGVSGPNYNPIDGAMVVSDPDLWQVDVLFPGESATLEVSYDISTGVAPGTLIETRLEQTGAFDRAGDVQLQTGAPAIEFSVPVGTAELTLAKSGTLNDDDGTPGVSAGDTIDYTFTVENTSDVTLTGIELDDPAATVTGGPISSLAAGALDNSTFTATYTLTQEDVDSGSFTNTATVTSSEGAVASDSDTQTWTAAAGISLDKRITQNAQYDAVGDVIQYAFDVTNTGNVTLAGPVLVTDGLTEDEACPALGDGDLDVGETATCTASYTVTQADLDNGSIQNTATATVDGQTSAPSSATATAAQTQSVSLGTRVTANDPYDAVGQIITFEFDVTNSGNVTLAGPVSVVDDLAADEACPSLPDGDLDVGETLVCTASYAVTQADIDNGSVATTTTASAGPVASAPVATTVNASQTLGMLISATGTPNDGGDGQLDAGDTIEYTFSVLNSGNTTLTSIQIVPQNGDVSVSGGPISLAPNASDTQAFTASYTLTASDISAGSFSTVFDGTSAEGAADSDLSTTTL
jgi:uncharacterized repeat protein (TIGR01451 family)